MAPTGSKIPPKAHSGSAKASQLGSKIGPATGKKGATQAHKGAPDRFSLKTLHSVVRQMKQTVTQKSSKPFNPAHLIVKTEELRAELRQAAKAGKSSTLSEFEEVFLEFFMGKRTLGALLQAGEKRYRKKKLQEWKEFFEQLFAYTQEKTTEADQIVEIIFRGISEEDPRPEIKRGEKRGPVLVCDVVTKRKRRNRTDKFVRLPIPNKQVLQRLKKLEPGSPIDIEDFLNGTGNALAFLSLYYRPVRKGLKTMQGDPTAERLEQQAKAASRARTALLSEKKDSPESEELYKKKSRLDKLLR